MWQDKLKEIIYILENSDVNEIEATFWGKKFRVVKNSPNILGGNSDKITTVNSPSKALELIKNDEFNVIVSDLKMPEMNGMVSITLEKAVGSEITVLVTINY